MLNVRYFKIYLSKLGNIWTNLSKTVSFYVQRVLYQSFTSLFSKVKDQYLTDLAYQLAQVILKSRADNTVSKYLIKCF